MDKLMIIIILFIVLEIPISYGMGLIFKKLNLEFKKGIIPFYNKVILIKEYKLPQYHLILIFIPLIGLYTNFLIYSKICKENNKDNLYIIELTLFPFVYNIFLGIELKQKQEKEKINNFFEEQKEMYETDEIEEKKEQDEYVWHPKKNIKSNVVYKASRNNLNAKVNINIKENNEIIDTKKQINNKEPENPKICPNCGAKVKNNANTCYICGTKL